MELFITLLMAQAFMGAFDTLYHHEFKVALPQRSNARLELAIHAMRAIFYAGLFLGLAWYEWRGYWVGLLVIVVLMEVMLTLWDFVIEDRTRLLPASERVTHTLLAINGGAAFMLLATQLPQWYAQPSEFYRVDYGWPSVVLTLAALGVFLSGMRDGLAAWEVQRLDLQLNLDLGGHRRILISGGTGFIGSAWVREVLAQGHEVTLITRHPVAATMQFEGKVRALASASELSDQEVFDVVINLAGAPVVGLPWSTKRKQVLTQSRMVSTQDLLRYVERAQQRPSVWIQASASGFYGARNEQTLDEFSAVGNGFAAELCYAWEAMTAGLNRLGVRRVVLRFGMVFGRSGGAFPMMLLPYRMGLGAVIGRGTQFMPWIHLEDVLRLMAHVIREPEVEGVINAVAPDQPTYREFAHLTGSLLQRPVWLWLPEALLRKVLGEMAGMFVDGPRIIPSRLEEIDFEFRFPQLRSAIMDLA